MSQQSLLEKLQVVNEKNLLIQGLPSSIEKQFVKLSYSKNVTPLLKIKKIDFALVFAINANQLNSILKEVIPCLNGEGKLWVAAPKSSSKIASDLNRDCSWDILCNNHYENVEQITLDHVWSATLFKRSANAAAVKLECKQVEEESSNSVDIKSVDFDKNLVVPPVELEKIFTRHKKAHEVFQNLSVKDQKEYVEWIEGAKRKDTRSRRLEATVEKLLAGKKTPLEK
ncbi:YdeI/OmpD-associated family protein [Aridibaculum aurantiacum]|uniref:YdeI/OmpD-associated family protein n=1 Tax=Aridibaculum aurantiacum TaxID=2810307 RepID=UPI001A96E555|nr:YdeI/OmpD-associated family protein [Aridibaculum aurantiacum]